MIERLIKLLRKTRNKLEFLLATDSLKVADYWRGKGVTVGKNTRIYKSVMFSNGGTDPVTIGANSTLTGCRIIAHDASTNFWLNKSYKIKSPAKEIIIGDNCFIGHGSIILMGVTIGHGSIVGAGAIVTKDVPEGVVVVGNPAKVVCTTFELVQKRKEEFNL